MIKKVPGRPERKDKALRGPLLVIAIVIFVLLLAVPLCSAGVMWTASGTAIRTYTSNQTEGIGTEITSDGLGGAIISWEEITYTWDGGFSTSTTDIYAQRVDSGGNTTWAKDGIPVCTSPFSQSRQGDEGR